MKFAIVGAGSIGSFVGASLAEAGFDVTLVGRGEHLRAIRERGIEVRGVRREFTVRVRATDLLSDVGVVDAILLTTKAHHVASVAPGLAPLMHDETFIVTMQNGVPWWYFEFGGGALAGSRLTSVDPDGTIARTVDTRRVIGSAINSGARLLAPGVVRQSGELHYAFGEPNGLLTARLQSLVDASARAGLDAVSDSNIRRTIWIKLIGNTTFNPISALTRATAAEMVGDERTVRLVREMMEEQVALGRRIGIDTDVSIEERIERTRILGDQRTSMLQDVEAARPLEIDAILGAVVEIADRVEAPLPATRRMLALVRLLDSRLTEARSRVGVEA